MKREHEASNLSVQENLNQVLNLQDINNNNDSSCETNSDMSMLSFDLQGDPLGPLSRNSSSYFLDTAALTGVVEGGKGEPVFGCDWEAGLDAGKEPLGRCSISKHIGCKSPLICSGLNSRDFSPKRKEEALGVEGEGVIKKKPYYKSEMPKIRLMEDLGGVEISFRGKSKEEEDLLDVGECSEMIASSIDGDVELMKQVFNVSGSRFNKCFDFGTNSNNNQGFTSVDRSCKSTQLLSPKVVQKKNEHMF